MEPTTILDVPAVMIWRDHVSHVGQAHGALLVRLFARDGSPTSERDAGWVLHLLETQGKIRRQGSKPRPTDQQRWAGAGGTFGVKGAGRPEVCRILQAA